MSSGSGRRRLWGLGAAHDRFDTLRRGAGRGSKVARFAKLVLSVCWALGLCGGVAFAQLPTASITGTVTDSSGAAVASAKVTATSEGTGIAHAVQTDSDGHYIILSLPIGVYDVSAEAPSFKSEIQEKLTLTVSQEAVINFALLVGSVNQKVTVVASAPLVETTNGTLGGLVDEQRVADLPLNGRNFTDLTLMQTGIAVQQSTLPTAPIGAVGSLITSNGAGVRSNYMSLDGASMVSAQGYNGASIISTNLGVEGIREFLVVTNNMKAEYGMVVGSYTIVATKNGTNQFHGTAFDYFRNNALDARDFFFPTFAKPAFHRNNFGGSVGGPIKKDKTFFFATYEGIRQKQDISSLLNLPTPTVFPTPAAPNTALIPNGGGSSATTAVPIANVVLPYLALYPAATSCLSAHPNDVFPYCTGGIGNSVQVFNVPISEDYIQGRVDETISGKDNLFVVYTTDSASETHTNGLAKWPEYLTSRSQFATIAENHIFSPTLLNTFRVSFSQPFLNFESPSTGPGWALGFPNNTMGDIGVTGMSGIGPTVNDPYEMRHSLFTFSDDLSWSHGVHTLKFGYLINHYHSKSDDAAPGRGSWSFTTLPNFLNAFPVQQLSLANPASDLARELKWDTIGVYAQDDWQVTPRLTLNLGLRYEISTTMKETTGHGWEMKNVLTDSLADITFAPPLFKNPTLHNFGPRFGFAWDVFGDAKTSVRGGAAYLYDIDTVIGGAQDGMSANPPLSGTNVITTGFTPPGGAQGFPQINVPSLAGSNTVRALDWNMGQPHLIEYNLGVDRALPGKMAVSVTYAGSRGLDLLEIKDVNEANPTVVNGVDYWSGIIPSCAKPGPNPRPNCNFQTIELRSATSQSWYNSLQVSVNKPLSHGLQYQVSYTYAHCLDETQGVISGEAGGTRVGQGQDPDNPSYDYGNCDYDIRHSFVSNFIYNVPNPFANGWAHTLLGGWRLATIFTAKTGQPFSVYTSGNASRSLVGSYASLNGDRLNVVPGCQVIPSGGPNIIHYFNPACFTPQPLYSIAGGVATPGCVQTGGVQCYGVLGNERRNQYFAPGLLDWDPSITKDTPVHWLGEAGAVEFRAEVFNILNHPNFAGPSTSAFTYTNTSTSVPTTVLPTAGQITRTAAINREIQFALKVIF